MRTVTECFTDLDDDYTLHFDGPNVRIDRNAKTLYDGPASALVATGEYHALTVDRAIDSDIDTVPRETIGQYVDDYLQSTPLP